MLRTVLKLPAYLTMMFPILLLVGSAVADIGMSTVAVLFLVRSFVEKDWAWTKESWVRCLFLLWIYMIARGVFAENAQEALRRSLPFARYFVFAAALAYWTLRDEQTYRNFLCVFSGVVFFLAADGLLQWLWHKDIFMRPIQELQGRLRLSGPFKKPILGIMMVWLSFPVCLQYIMDMHGKFRLTPLALAIFLIFVVIVLSGERMALLLLALGWLIAAFNMPVRRFYILGFFTVCIALFAVLVFTNTELFSRQVLSTVDTFQNWEKSPYGMLLSSDAKLAEVNPVFGVGSNNYRFVCKEMFTNVDSCNIHPHNIYLEWLIEQGIIGFILFIGFIAVLVRKCCCSWPVLKTNPVFLGLAIALILRLWPFMPTTSFFSNWGAPPFWLIVGVFLMYITRVEERSEYQT